MICYFLICYIVLVFMNLEKCLYFEKLIIVCRWISLLIKYWRYFFLSNLVLKIIYNRWICYGMREIMMD